MTALPSQPWIHSAKVDLAFILAPAFVVTAGALALMASGRGLAGVSLISWVVLVVGVDVAHVYGTLYRTYADRQERSRLAGWLVAVPLGAWIAGTMLYAWSALAFWCVLAYTAVFHFVRQQYGFLMIYARRERELPAWCRRLDQTAIYGATLGPLLYWHTHLPQPFVWFIDGDFVPLPSWLWSAAQPLYGALVAAYVLKELWLARHRLGFNLPRNAIVLGTAGSWYVGIVLARGDLVFTLTNVVAHGVPYIALTCIYGNHRDRQERRPRSWFVPSLLPLTVGLLILLAYLEEGLWDGLIWREHVKLFPGFDVLPLIRDSGLLSLLVPLLALPQTTHYLLDAVIWRLRTHPEWRSTLFWRPSPAEAG